MHSCSWTAADFIASSTINNGSKRTSRLMSTDFEGYLDSEKKDSVSAGGARRIFGMIARHRSATALGVLLIILGTFAALLEPRLFGYAIDDAIVPRDWTRLMQLGVA